MSAFIGGSGSLGSCMYNGFMDTLFCINNSMQELMKLHFIVELCLRKYYNVNFPTLIVKYRLLVTWVAPKQICI